MDWTLEVVVLPVSDLDGAVAFYRDQVGVADPDGSTWAVQQLKVRGGKPLIPREPRDRSGEVG